MAITVIPPGGTPYPISSDSPNPGGTATPDPWGVTPSPVQSVTPMPLQQPGTVSVYVPIVQDDAWKGFWVGLTGVVVKGVIALMILVVAGVVF